MEGSDEKDSCKEYSVKATYTAIIEREDDMFVALCPELDIASQGTSIEDAKINLIEAVELFFETADEMEQQRRYHAQSWITSFEVTVGQA